MRIEDRRSKIASSIRSSILDPRSGVRQVFARDLGTHRFQHAVSAKDALIGSAAPRSRIACFERLSLGNTRGQIRSRFRLPNNLLSETARWKRCVPSFIPTAPQKRDEHPPQSSILPKPVSATILPAVMKLGVIINLLIGVGLSASPYLWPEAAPVQASAIERSAAQSAQESNSLEPGKPIQRELSGGQSHSYKITMISGQYLHVVVDQRGIDVAVALFTPDGKKISDADSEHLVERSETVSAIAEAPGTYLIEVRSPEKTAKAGRYEIEVDELRAATAEDKYRVAGELIFREAEQLRNGTLEAKRKSIEKYHEALELYRRATDRNGEAQTLSNIGEVYWSLGEMRKALEKYDEALPIRRAIGNRSGEAETLNNIGLVYWSLGEMRKALEKYDEALPIRRAIGDRKGEAVILDLLRCSESMS